MNLSRREFLEAAGLGTVSVLGFSLFESPRSVHAAEAAQPKKIAEVPVLWIATGACSGCSVALLNAASPSVQELLLDQVLPGKHLSLGFHTTVMAASGQQAISTIEKTATENGGKYVLVVDGATATKDQGVYCSIGELEDGSPLTGYRQVAELGSRAMAVLAVGACAAFGGIPAAPPNPTDCVSIAELFQREGITTPFVNIPGCPPHPDWIVGTIATVLIGGVDALQLDEQHRPAPFFRECIHDNCQFRGHFERGQFAERFGQHGCLLKLGCKGPITYADCPIRKFNNGTSWCCEVGHPCIGCCHPDFPFEKSMFVPIEPSQLDYPAVYPRAVEDLKSNTDTYVAVGLLGAGGFLAGVGVTAAAMKLKGAKSAENPPAEEPSHGEA